MASTALSPAENGPTATTARTELNKGCFSEGDIDFTLDGKTPIIYENLVSGLGVPSCSIGITGIFSLISPGAECPERDKLHPKNSKVLTVVPMGLVKAETNVTAISELMAAVKWEATISCLQIPVMIFKCTDNGTPTGISTLIPEDGIAVPIEGNAEALLGLYRMGDTFSAVLNHVVFTSLPRFGSNRSIPIPKVKLGTTYMTYCLTIDLQSPVTGSQIHSLDFPLGSINIAHHNPDFFLASVLALKPQVRLLLFDGLSLFVTFPNCQGPHVPKFIKKRQHFLIPLKAMHPIIAYMLTGSPLYIKGGRVTLIPSPYTSRILPAHRSTIADLGRKFRRLSLN